MPLNGELKITPLYVELIFLIHLVVLFALNFSFPFAYYKRKSRELLFSLVIAKKRLRKYSSIYLCRWVLVEVYLQCNWFELNEIFFLSAPKTWHFIYVHSGFNAHSFFYNHWVPLRFSVFSQWYNLSFCFFFSLSYREVKLYYQSHSYRKTTRQDKTLPTQQKFPQKKGPLNSYTRTCNIIGSLKS